MLFVIMLGETIEFESFEDDLSIADDVEVVVELVVMVVVDGVVAEGDVNSLKILLLMVASVDDVVELVVIIILGVVAKMDVVE